MKNLKFLTPILKSVGGGVAGDVMMDLIEDKLIPALPESIRNKAPKQTAQVITLAVGSAIEYFASSNSKMKQFEGVGAGMATVAGAEIVRSMVPGLSGMIGDIIEDPFRRTNRTIPYTTQISK